MYLSCIKIRGFRNHEELVLHPHPGINLIFGANGAGKTNLLEAIHYCALGKSHRSVSDREVIRQGNGMAACGVTVESKTARYSIAVKLLAEGDKKKQIFVNQKKVAKISDLMGGVKCVIFSPEDLLLVKEGPPVRRRLMDMMLSQMSRTYFSALVVYRHALDQRSALLRQVRMGAPMNESRKAMLSAYEDVMAEEMAVIEPARRQAMEELRRLCRDKYRSISGRATETFDLVFASCFEKEGDWKQMAREKLEACREDDLRRGGAGFGIHREDLVLRLNEKEMKVFASQGQMRTAALAIKLSQLQYFQNRTGESPILLLDDVMSELDMTRRTRLLKEIQGVQTFVTCTDESDLMTEDEHRRYYVENIDGQAKVTEIAGGAALPEKDTSDPEFV